MYTLYKGSPLFTWKPIYAEIANKLLEFEGDNARLVTLLKRFEANGLKVSSLKDRSENGKDILLREIDPFTFFGNFNRGIRDENRRAILAELKQEWNLAAPLPIDFSGLPLLNLQQAWLMPYEEKRAKNHVPTLWRFYRHVMGLTDYHSLDVDLFDACIALKHVGLATLTMGMFWCRPEDWIALDAKNRAMARSLGVDSVPTNGAEYLQWLDDVRATTKDSPAELSYKAHLRATAKSLAPPFDSLFTSEEQANTVLDYFQPVLEALEGSEESDCLACTLRTNGKAGGRLSVIYGRWVALRYDRKGAKCTYEVLLASDSPALKTLPITYTYSQTVAGKTYVLAKMDQATFEQGYERMLEERLKAIEAAKTAFAHYEYTPYTEFHTVGLIDLIMDPSSRADVLATGLSSKENDVDYWLLAPGQKAYFWDEWQAQKIGAIGWSDAGDLTEYGSKEELIEYLQDNEIADGPKAAASMLWNFAVEMKPGDVVFAKNGLHKICGWGVVTGEYTYDENQDEFMHIIPVDWKSDKEHTMLGGVQLAMQTLTLMSKKRSFLKEMAQAYLGIPGLDNGPDSGEDRLTPTPPLDPYLKSEALKDLFLPEETVDKILRQLRRKKNVVLQGAPGTGKTFVARRLAYLLLGTKDESRVPMIQFHQSTTYEDFIQGYRPNGKDGFSLRNGGFYNFVQHARERPDLDFVLIIDEINRGNLSKVFGELMMLIECDKRSSDYALPLTYATDSDEPFYVPPNVYLIGTMNTADRSLSMVDYALRRRFAFVELDPGFDSPVFSEHLQRLGAPVAIVEDVRQRMSRLNQMIAEDTANLGRGFRIGHSFFVPSSDQPINRAWIDEVVEFEILPLIEEYWCDDPTQLERARHIALGKS